MPAALIYLLILLFFDADAAILMLKNMIHRIPIVNDSNQVAGELATFSIILG